MLSHTDPKFSSFFAVQRGSVRPEKITGYKPPSMDQVSFQLLRPDTQGEVSDSFETSVIITTQEREYFDRAPDGTSTESELNKWVSVSVTDWDESPNLQLALRDDEGIARLQVRNPNGKEESSLEFTIGKTEELRPELFEAGFFAEQAGKGIKSLDFRGDFLGVDAEPGPPGSLSVNNKLVKLTSRPLFSSIGEKDPELAAKLRDLWNS